MPTLATLVTPSIQPPSAVAWLGYDRRIPFVALAAASLLDPARLH